MISLTEFFSLLPVIFQYIQLIGYVILLLFFGSIATKGWKGYLPWYLNIGLRIAAGALCLFAGIALGPFIPTLNTGIFRLFQSHIIAAGIVSSIILSVALYLISYKSEGVAESLKRQIARWQERLNKFKPVRGWTVQKIIGIALVLSLIVFSAVNFREFPSNVAEEFIASFMPKALPGMSLGKGMRELSPDCLSAMMALSKNPNIFQNASLYENEQLKTMIEQEIESQVEAMFISEYEGKQIILIKSGNRKCVATPNEFCACFGES